MTGAPPLPPGWYDDPSGRFDLRYHNGFAWTADVSDDGRRFVDPPGERAAPPTEPSPDTGNPIATVAMVVGIGSICLAWVPIVFVVGAILAVLAIVFGVVGRRRAAERGLDANRAVVGLITGTVGLGCVVVGAILTVVLVRAVDRWENPAAHEVTLLTCTVDPPDVGDGSWQATGELVNVDDRRSDFTVKVRVRRDDGGGSGPSATEELDAVDPGATVPFEVGGAQDFPFEPVCEVEVFGPLPFGVDLSG